MITANIAQAARQHDRFVVTAQQTLCVWRKMFEGAEISIQRRAPEFVVKSRGANRTIEHDVECAGEARIQGALFFPRRRQAWNAQMGHAEAGESRLGFGAAPGCTLIADLTTCAGGGAGVG